MFSSSLNALIKSGHINIELNSRAFLKIALFGYITGTDTLIKNVFRQSYASILRVTKEQIQEDHYWDIMNTITPSKQLMEKQEALQSCDEILQNIVSLYVSDQQHFAVTFTGGYDSRTLLSLLKRDRKDFFCFSYGRKGSFDIQIPQAICSEQHINFRTFYLDDDFEQNFEYYALRALYHSDGVGSIIKANMVYPLEKIFGSIDCMLTGLFGSEIIKQPSSVGSFITSSIRNMLLSKDPRSKYDQLVEQETKKHYLPTKIFRDYKDEVYNELEQLFLTGTSEKYIFFNFLFKEGIRNYFMQELRLERVYLENKHPYFDDDFVEFLFKTPFAGIYNFSKGRNVVQALRPHLLYAHIINANKPAFGNYITTHGYKPADILSYATLPKAIYDYLLNNKKIQKKNTYDYKKWTRAFYQKYIDLISNNDKIIQKEIKEKYINQVHLKNVDEFAQYFSLQLYLNLHGL
ncbi:MAG: hypothetical protein A2Y62_02720 [Candidatus Fischerbacteria bacterium RBG_13_37_8]|uniref:asparagine synthase (glutamine-hydrolyzing) n=1 Tax=Candidatus Fischerbacteria bacterium RBG_13_37_8 TaxID=1817863 RepID=A0A1F5VY93_9BACT|nr:MAG: hypothetical protein A2Y62_02720 [Candidatus Fischerbacteria bacterium RBG_13_37_8]